ncbi:MAG TPA: hypothetical protein VHD35_07910, partial [Chitinophagaceae bacterium]|nr:hypothetical protein [Chitinophagaceae bacterium]
MRRFFYLLSFLLSVIISSAQVHYTLLYTDSSRSVLTISIQLTTPISNANFVMPRSIPGGYQIYAYDN